MKTNNIGSKFGLTLLLSASLFGMGGVFAAGTAQAGHNGNSGLIKAAIASNSVDAIEAELERTEYLVCAACSDLVVPLVDHLDYRVRKVAAWWIARRGINREVYVNMLGRLSQPDSFLARNAADVLGELGFTGAIPALSAALSNPIFSAEARAASARALGSIGRQEAFPALVSALGSSDPSVKAASLASLRQIQGFQQAAAAAPLLADSDEQVRAEAALTLGTALRTGKVGVQPAGVDQLLAVLATDPSADVRKKAAWSLGEMGAPVSQAAPGLEAAAGSDSNPAVRSLARVAISKLSR
jgi:HEAT repeat protein